jgi:ABC-type antimicrobial peptide transport system permease subunit
LKRNAPPKFALRFFRWYCSPKLIDYIEGDLLEGYKRQFEKSGKRNADLHLIKEVLLLFRPGIIKPAEGYQKSNTYGMYKSYFKIGWRNLLRNKGYSFINIGGLATGMAVAILIGLWIWDELSFNQSHQNYDRIAQVMQTNTINNKTESDVALPIPLANELRTNYGSDFKYVLLSSWTEGHMLSIGEKKFWMKGNYIDPEAVEMLSLKIIKGTKSGLKDPYSIMICQSVAKAFFGNDNPLENIILIDNEIAVKVTGVYEDLPYNSQFSGLDYIAPWQLNVAIRGWVKDSQTRWDNSSFQIYAQIADHADMQNVSEKIKDAKLASGDEGIKKANPVIFLQPMSRMHLYSEFKNGVNVGGRIQFVWLFSIIGVFVLLLACINFMNLSTARSEKRAKEVGIRMTVGSVRKQLIYQFLSESFLVVMLAFVLAISLVSLSLAPFNDLADKKILIEWSNPFFWLLSFAFIVFTSLLAGSYPALYLSSFKPIKVLKGSFKVGRFASLPRKALVVLQFTVSITLIIGTVIVFQQIQFAKNRPIGYDRNGLIYIQTITSDIHNHYEAARNEFIQSGAVMEMAESESPLTQVWNYNGGFSWAGKDPNQSGEFATIGVTHEFGTTVSWEFIEGRDFSKDFPSDSMAIITNEAAVKFMGMKNPVGEMLDVPAGHGKREQYKIIGVIKDMVMNSPYEPAKQTLFYLGKNSSNFINIKINPNTSSSEALTKIETIFKKYSPSSLFDYKFADDEYAKKFSQEERIGKLASLFATLAVFISCLGLFGVASYMAEQRTKEIGVRKVMGASVLSLWKMLSKDFVFLVIIAVSISIPVAYYFMDNWLQKYEYRTEISWWVFAASGMAALVITLLTVSFQSIKAAMMNPVNSLRSE